MSLAALSDYPWRIWAEQRAAQTALITEQGALTWQQLATEIDLRARYLAARGVSAGTGVALLGRNSSALLLDYLAVIQLGARVLPLNPQLPELQRAELVQKLDIGLLFDLQCSELQGSDLQTCHASCTVDTDNLAQHNRQTTCDYQPECRAPWQPSRPATVTLTSGSSGLPKGVVHSVANHLASADGLLQLMHFTAADSWLLSLPLFHVSGQGIVWRWLLRGARLVLRDTRDLSHALHGCTHASLVPTQLYRLLNQRAQQDKPAVKPVLREVLLGGAMIPVDLTTQAERVGIACWCGYGMTEMASTVSAKRADSLPGVGQCLPRRMLHLEHGEIWVKGEPLALGYWREGAIEPLTNPQGWFATRDRGCWENQELRILGRLDNMFISGGENIQPEEIERILAQHSQVMQAFVLPVPDCEFGQRPVAVLQLNSHNNTLFTDIAQWLMPQISRFKQPIAYYALPENLQQGGIKVSRKAVAIWLAEQS
ncbi:o-succinylbenzoate--CoA ligase [Plesiomonas sp.]|uniref:o-succinylbenzoate--CoA ligase n=1 Tax=Plesiomonas sp. TaxID=2486279 RepID=UPI003F2FEFE3